MFVLIRLVRIITECRILFNCGFLLAVALCAAANVPAQESITMDCGALRNHYGPFDYTNADHYANNLPVVERRHFTLEVEALVRGETGSIELDLNYTLRTFPNHHRALYAVAKLQLRSGFRRMRDYLTADCYFDRAMRFKPDDAKVRMLYGLYLHKKGNFDEAMLRYKEALVAVPDDIELHYNIGLLYCDLKDYPAAIPHAQTAYAAGYPLPGLRNRLIKAGAWDQDSGKSDVKQP